MASLNYSERENFQQLKPEEIWNHLRDDNDLALVILYNRFIDDIYHYGERITNDKELIKDCIQDIFVDLWCNRKKLPEVTSLKHYLFKVLKRAIIKKLERNRRLFGEKNISEDHDIQIVLSYESRLISSQISEQQQKRLLKSLNSLPIRQKEAITLKFLDGFSYQEVADILSISIKSTYNLIYRALDLLKDNLLKFISFLLIHIHF
ncbi:sigma-70 family RNA polymerase sigma factor [Fulvivirgaceae bacterium BMA10]|uniref:Sigma-70 family RNA polymerase sigma factor n=1 Tax=Splendidivirga corallicola TaxID=3051826 RepID=A0ABT8KN88_9BACT|nr:sigma-70 family RNA polymerase sigma factor [Fulvivirgaceae bacterium BMA10]